MKEPLLPCPFCGGKAEMFTDDNEFYYVRCLDCNAMTDIESQSVNRPINPATLWNRRPQSPPVAQGRQLEDLINLIGEGMYHCENHAKCEAGKLAEEALKLLDSKPVAQVGAYRKALEEITHCGLLATEVEDLVANAAHVLEVAKKALLTSKPEPVAPIREWEAKTVVGEIVFYPTGSSLDDSNERSVNVRFEDLSPEVQDALRGRKSDR